jgi:hypothetical protein
MREEVLKQFFLGNIHGAQLQEDLRNTVRQLDSLVSDVRIEDMKASFQVRREHLIALCDAVADGSLQPDSLEPMGFALMASDAFEWEDELMSEIIADWSSPEINYPLNLSTVEQFKRWLTGKEPYPERPMSNRSQPQDRLISLTRKRSIK